MQAQEDSKRELIQYADDTVIFTSGHSIVKNKIQLSPCAMKLTRYFHEHQLSIIATKTEFIIFSKTVGKNKKQLIKSDGPVVEEKQEIKYLGVHIDNRLIFQSHVKFLKFCF